MSNGFSDYEYDKFVQKSHKNLKSYKDAEALQSAFVMQDAKKKIGYDKIMDPSIRNDITEFVTPLKINNNQRKLMGFLFGEGNVDKVLNNRVKIYNGQLNDQCPNYGNPDATQAYINPVTQKLECRIPIPRRAETGAPLDCAVQALNGPNPFAIEKYIRQDGTATCRVPVVRGKFFCNESGKGPADFSGEHVTLPDGTGVCIPSQQQLLVRETDEINAKANQIQGNILRRTLQNKFFPDQATQIPTPQEIMGSPYYGMFTRHKFKEGYMDSLVKLSSLDFKDGKQRVFNYLAGMRSPLTAAEKQAVDGLYSNPKSDALYKFHRDLFWYIKENYPDYLKKQLPNEDRMRFLGYLGPAVFNNSNVKTSTV